MCALLLAGPATAARRRGSAPVNTSPPVISGTPTQGQTLSASTGSWLNAPTSYAYRWQRCAGGTCAAISGATAPTYQLQQADVGDAVNVVVTASNRYGSGSATSAQTATIAAAPPPPPPNGLHVSGTQLLDANNSSVRLHGVDRSGAEYACIQGWGIFDGPNLTNDDSQVPLMQAWKANSALIGLNEDCWLGINGVSSAYGGQNYINAIVHETKTLESYGLYPVISMFWTAPGTTQATGQAAMPDADHSPAFWQSVANTFKGDRNVILRLKEEPYPAGNSDTVSAWQCWNAGDVQYDSSNTLVPVSQVSHCSEGYKTVGMQSLVDIVRGTGATNVIQVPGVQYANSMTHFLDAGIRPGDTLSPPQLMGDVDVYPNGNICGSTACYDNEYAPVAAQMPFMFGEFGESVDGSDCSTTAVDALMGWADQHGASYSAWDWDTWGGCLQLITDYTTGNPNGNWGTDYKNHLASFP
jgi:endoglucanase